MTLTQRLCRRPAYIVLWTFNRASRLFAALTLVTVSVCAGYTVAIQLHPSPASCTFDGGGSIRSGEAARTTEGRIWVCLDGTLIPVTGYGTDAQRP